MIKLMIIAISMFFVYRGVQIHSMIADESWQNEVANDLKKAAIKTLERGRDNIYLSGSKTETEKFKGLDINALAVEVVDRAIEGELRKARLIGGLHITAGVFLLVGVIIFI